MIPVTVYNPTGEFYLNRDESVVEVEEFTPEAVVAAMRERDWNFELGRVYVAVRGSHGGYFSAFVFRVSTQPRAEIVT